MLEKWLSNLLLTSLLVNFNTYFYNISFKPTKPEGSYIYKY